MQEAKADAGKLELDLVPMQIVRDIAQVRMYGNAKYGDPDNWKLVELRRYINALLRHTLEFLEDHHSVDEESGIEHYKHMACNMAFICYMMKEGAQLLQGNAFEFRVDDVQLEKSWKKNSLDAALMRWAFEEGGRA